MNLTFKGKSAIVTGACGGMGLEISKNLSNNQILVLMIDLKEPPKNFLKDNPPIAQEIENRILQNAGVVEKAMMEGEIESKKTKEEKTEE